MVKYELPMIERITKKCHLQQIQDQDEMNRNGTYMISDCSRGSEEARSTVDVWRAYSPTLK